MFRLKKTLEGQELSCLEMGAAHLAWVDEEATGRLCPLGLWLFLSSTSCRCGRAGGRRALGLWGPVGDVHLPKWLSPGVEAEPAAAVRAC